MKQRCGICHKGEVPEDRVICDNCIEEIREQLRPVLDALADG